MKTALIIVFFCLCSNTFAQEFNKKIEKPSPFILLKYSIKEKLFPDTVELMPPAVPYGGIISFSKKNFSINKKIMSSEFSNPIQADLSKQLRNIMHKFPGDGNNLFIDAKGLKTN